MISFIVSAFFTLVASTAAAYLHGDKLWLKIDSNGQSYMQRFDKCTTSSWLRLLDRLVLGLSDQQLVSGIAILLIAIITRCRIATYHFQLIMDLGTLSCATHFVSVVSLRTYFRKYLTAAITRIVAMVFFAALLVTGSFLTGRSTPRDQLKCIASCRAKNARDTRFWLYTTLWSICFIIGYIMTLVLLLGEACLRISERSALQIRSLKWLGLLMCCHTVSMSLGSGCLPLILNRSYSAKVVKESEGTWTFGQMLALLMIALPFLTTIQAYIGRRFSSSHENVHLGLIQGRGAADIKYGRRCWRWTSSTRSL